MANEIEWIALPGGHGAISKEAHDYIVKTLDDAFKCIADQLEKELNEDRNSPTTKAGTV